VEVVNGAMEEATEADQQAIRTHLQQQQQQQQQRGCQGAAAASEVAHVAVCCDEVHHCNWQGPAVKRCPRHAVPGDQQTELQFVKTLPVITKL
jgi:hypothetical protein